MRTAILIASTLCWFVTLDVPYALAELPILVVSNPAHPIKLDSEEIREVFLGVRTLVKDWRVVPLDQKIDSAIREDFYRTIAGKSPVEMKVYWAEQIFSGKAKAPSTVEDDQAVIKIIHSNLDAIGYVSGSTDTGKLNVILRLK